MKRSEIFHDYKTAALAAGKHADHKVTGGARAVAVAASGDITFSAQPAANDTVTINGLTLTLVTSGAVAGQVNLGAALTNTIDNLVSALNSSSDVRVSSATYSNGSGTKLHVVYDFAGTVGNAFKLAENSANATVSGATLSGGLNVDSDKIDLSAETYGLVTTATGGAFLLPAGDQGQEVTLYLDTKVTSNAVVTGTFAGGTTATFDTAGDFIKLKWLKDKWVVLVNSSVTIA
jgi:hypothetical protein